jgi:hypothetical protein
MKDYEEGRRCLSPSVFRKSKGPIILTTSSSALTANNSIDASIKGLNNGLKKGLADPSGISKEIGMQDFDINQCMDIKDVHSKIDIPHLYSSNDEGFRYLFEHGLTIILWIAHSPTLWRQGIKS